MYTRICRFACSVYFKVSRIRPLCLNCVMIFKISILWNIYSLYICFKVDLSIINLFAECSLLSPFWPVTRPQFNRKCLHWESRNLRTLVEIVVNKNVSQYNALFSTLLHKHFKAAKLASFQTFMLAGKWCPTKLKIKWNKIK